MTAAHRCLIVYYSRSGHTARVARDLAARLKADVEQIGDEADRRGLLGYLRAAWQSNRGIAADISPPMADPAAYALTVVGTPVWSWKITPAVRAYLQQTRGRVRALACFVTSGDTAVEKIAPEMERIAGCPAVAVTGLSAQELHDAAAYERKLSAFVTRLQRVATP